LSLRGSLRGHIYPCLLVTWTLVGLWHGASWNFVLWGVYHAALLSLHRLCRPLLARVKTPNEASRRAWATVRWFGTFNMVVLGLVLFKLPDFSQALLYLRAIAINWNEPLELRPLFAIAFFSLPVVLIHAKALMPENKRSSEPWLHASAPPTWRAAAVYGAMLFLLLFDAGPAGEFIYFQF
jgi:alginate O-acetyltransferase complex protein AlgI